MADRVYPSAKPTTNGTTNGTATARTTADNASFPATKAQLYGASRPAYRPQPQRKRSRRRYCCLCCIWFTILILTLILLAAIAGAVIYVIYRPHRPSFTVSAFKVSSLNLTSNSHLITNMNMNITAKNPNKKLIYIYNPITISVKTVKDDIVIGNGTVPSFVHGTKNTTLLKVGISNSNGQQLDDITSGQLKSEFKSKNGVGLKLEMETKVKMKLEGLKTPKVGIRVTCDGIKVTVPSGKKPTTAAVSNVKCKVDLRIKIWRFTF